MRQLGAVLVGNARADARVRARPRTVRTVFGRPNSTGFRAFGVGAAVAMTVLHTMKPSTLVSTLSVAALSLLPRLALADDKPVGAAEEKKVDDRYGVIGTLSFARVSSLGGVDKASSGLGGGGLTFSGGYMWNHFGYDIVGGLTFDTGDNHGIDPSGAPSSTSTERISGMGAARFRASIQNDWARLSLAAGPGFVYRVVGTAKSFPSLPSEVDTYKSVAVNVDLSAQLRIGKSTSLTVGAQLWADNASGAGRETTFMPYLGFQWGP